jgi:hypothetical protein
MVHFTNLPTGRTSDQYMLRFPEGMRQKLKALAALNRRSLNSEVIFHLDRALANETATEALVGASTSAAALTHKERSLADADG